MNFDFLSVDLLLVSLLSGYQINFMMSKKLLHSYVHLHQGLKLILNIAIALAC